MVSIYNFGYFKTYTCKKVHVVTVRSSNWLPGYFCEIVLAVEGPDFNSNFYSALVNFVKNNSHLIAHSWRLLGNLLDIYKTQFQLYAFLFFELKRE